MKIEISPYELKVGIRFFNTQNNECLVVKEEKSRFRILGLNGNYYPVDKIANKIYILSETIRSNERFLERSLKRNIMYSSLIPLFEREVLEKNFYNKAYYEELRVKYNSAAKAFREPFPRPSAVVNTQYLKFEDLEVGMRLLCHTQKRLVLEIYDGRIQLLSSDGRIFSVTHKTPVFSMPGKNYTVGYTIDEDCGANRKFFNHTFPRFKCKEKFKSYLEKFEKHNFFEDWKTGKPTMTIPIDSLRPDKKLGFEDMVVGMRLHYASQSNGNQRLVLEVEKDCVQILYETGRIVKTVKTSSVFTRRDYKLDKNPNSNQGFLFKIRTKVTGQNLVDVSEWYSKFNVNNFYEKFKGGKIVLTYSKMLENLEYFQSGVFPIEKPYRYTMGYDPYSLPFQRSLWWDEGRMVGKLGIVNFNKINYKLLIKHLKL